MNTQISPQRCLGIALGAMLIANLTTSPAAQTPIGALPAPSGITQRPAETYLAEEHGNVDGSLHLQGSRTAEKYAPVMYGAGGFLVADLQTAVIVNNPDRTQQLDVLLDYFNRSGLLLRTTSASIGPLSSYREAAELRNDAGTVTDSVGTVRVRVTASSPVRSFVGATVYYANRVANPLDLPGPPLNATPSMTSMQPLQQVQRTATTLTLGPIPAHSFLPTSQIDLLNGVFGVINLCNPASAINTVRVVVTGTSGFTSTLDVLIKPRGAIQDFRAWRRALEVMTVPRPNEELTVTATSLNNLPLIGELLMFDLASNDGFSDGRLMVTGGRVRLASTMAASTPTTQLINPELVNNLSVGTTMGIVNASAANTGPLTITYWSENGTVLATDNLPGLPLQQAIMVGANLPTSPSFPTGNIFRGWVQVTAANGGIVGWSMRGGEGDQPNTSARSYAELMFGAAGAEHQRGWLDSGARFSIAPLAFDWLDELQEPGYIAILNDQVANTNAYLYQFWRPGSPESNPATLAGTQQFAGLRALQTSLTYEDAIINALNPVHTGVVGVTTGSVTGIATIGGNLFGRLPLVIEVTGWPGPGDL